MFSSTLPERDWVNDMTKTLNAYRGLTARNTKVFLKDKMVIFFSLLTQLIVLGLFLLFIKNSYADGVSESLGPLRDTVAKADTEALLNSWMVSGVIGTAVITATMNALSVMVSDKQDKVDYDYNASSVKGSVIVMSYFSGAVLCSLITSFILLTAGLIFLAVTGTFLLTALDIITMYGLVILGSVSAAIVLMTVISFFKKSSTFTSFSILISTLVGFIVGAYVPVSQFGDTTQTIVNLIPGAQITGLMRNVLVTPAIDNIDKALGGMDQGQFSAMANRLFAVKMNIFGTEIDAGFMLLYSLIAIAVFLVLNIILFRFSSKRKA